MSRDDGCMAAPSPPTLDELRRLAPTLQGITAAHGALGLQVFGSVVHGLAGPGSDLDLLVEFPSSPSFEQFMDLKLALEDLLSVPVDLVTSRGLRAELRQRIEDEAIPLA
jgi:predicted nucleotidyltransferase